MRRDFPSRGHRRTRKAGAATEAATATETAAETETETETETDALWFRDTNQSH
jgi:carbohydrate-binding DOMON domain-containing protein